MSLDRTTAPACVAPATIAPPGNETPRVLRELKRRALGADRVVIPADLARQMVAAIETGIAFAAAIEGLAPPGLANFAEAVAALRRHHGRIPGGQR